MSNRIEDLDPLVQPRARSFLSLIPVPYVVTSTLRTADEQVAYYAQGRAPLEIVNLLRKKAGMWSIDDKANRGTVTQRDGVNTLSNHQGGRALDVVPAGAGGHPIWPDKSDPRWEMIGKAGEAAGFTWGGRWSNFPDFPHFEMA